mgnify:CR=1 FL=1
MGTVQTYGDRASIKIRDSAERQFTTTDKLALLNTIIEHDVYPALVHVESKMVYAAGDITTADGTIEYTPSFSHNGFLKDGVWLDGEDWFLKEVHEADKVAYDYDSVESEPEAYYINEDGDAGFLWVPDDAYTVHCLYWNPVTALTDYDSDDLPYRVWEAYFEEDLTLRMMQILERDVSEQAVIASIARQNAMNMTYRFGVRQYRQKSDMFSIEGI